MYEKCVKCGCEEWRCEKANGRQTHLFVYVCVKCGHERAPNAKEKEEFNG